MTEGIPLLRKPIRDAKKYINVHPIIYTSKL